jgi:3-hydroxyacyl-CoA dehydrogenase
MRDDVLAVNLLGYGQMGRQIASLLCLLGCDVVVWCRTLPEESYVQRQIKFASKLLEVPINENTIRIVSSLGELNKDAITIEAITEDIEIKRGLYNLCRPYLLGGYYTNSSSYSPVEIGEEVGGLHFFNPITLRLVEYCPAAFTKGGGIVNILTLLNLNSFNVIDVQPNRGYLANSLLFREIANVFFMIEQCRYSVSAIESVYAALHKDRSIFDIVDLVGVDVTYAILDNLKLQDSSVYLPRSLRFAIEKSILGKKNKTSIKDFLNESKW